MGDPGKALDCEEFIANAEEMAAKVTEAVTKEHEQHRHYQEKAPVTKVEGRRHRVARAPLQAQ